MLQQLYLKNFILIDEISLNFKNGFSVFVGETGAGKSLIVDALQIIKGERASSSFIKKNKEKAIIEAIFLLDTKKQKIIEEYGFEVEDEILIITKEITKEKTYTKLNHRIITNSLLKEIMNHFLEIQEQHSLNDFLNDKKHLSLLDLYGKINIKELHQIFNELQNLKSELNMILNNEDNDIDYLKFQLAEINDVNPTENEDVELREIQKKYLEQARQKDVILEILSKIKIDDVYNLANEIAFLPDIKENLLDAYYTLDENIQNIANIYNVEDEVDIDAIQERLFKIQALKKKFGGSLESVFKKKLFFEEKIYQLEEKDYLITQLESKIKSKEAECFKLANILTKQRKEVALKLEQELIKELSDLAFHFIDFKILFEEQPLTKNGEDKITFLISLNKGEDLKKLTQVASGGELSRILLALKTIFARYQDIDTIIFDEIDTGVSGKVAFEIGKKLNKMAYQKQVFNISHVSAVIACADYVYGVKKKEINENTISEISLLTEDEIIEELALISNSNLSTQSLLSAKELYTLAQKSVKNE